MFLRTHPGVYARLNGAAKVAIKNFVEGDVNQQVLAWFLEDNPVQYVAGVLAGIKDEELGEYEIKDRTYARLLDFLRSAGDTSPAKQYAIRAYTLSPNFRTADIRYDRFVLPSLDDFDQTDIEQFLSECEQNNQTYNRSVYAHLAVRKRIEQLGLAEFDYAPYTRVSQKMLDDELYAEFLSDDEEQ